VDKTRGEEARGKKENFNRGRAEKSSSYRKTTGKNLKNSLCREVERGGPSCSTIKIFNAPEKQKKKLRTRSLKKKAKGKEGTTRG